MGRRLPTRVVWSCGGIVFVLAHRLRGSGSSCSGSCRADASRGLGPPWTSATGVRVKRWLEIAPYLAAARAVSAPDFGRRVGPLSKDFSLARVTGEWLLAAARSPSRHNGSRGLDLLSRVGVVPVLQGEHVPLDIGGWPWQSVPAWKRMIIDLTLRRLRTVSAPDFSRSVGPLSVCARMEADDNRPYLATAANRFGT